MATDNIHARKAKKEMIDVHDPSELKYLAMKFGVIQEQILQAVISVGDDEHAVENYLKENKFI